MIVPAGALVHYDVNLPIKLQCDACPYGVGAVLSHVMEDGTDRPIAFASRALTSVSVTTHISTPSSCTDLWSQGFPPVPFWPEIHLSNGSQTSCDHVGSADGSSTDDCC